ncbi:hypothetical protein SAMN04487956_1572 [Halomonas saccharevitans]|uniref:Uncharacterized protein n=2 Tax=Halomonas saccharevitans TaxID=416872 RepID=A0A1I7CQQ1_9GAMM|nr:hypothetical protein SAMN04487956_1572 [Halomonas saccharevitans]
MTYWAILAGLIYVAWHLLETFSELSFGVSSRLGFYLSFSQMYLILLSISLLVASGGTSKGKSKLDYRVFRKGGGDLPAIFFLLFFLGLPLYSVYQVNSASAHNLLFGIQSSINFWSVAIFFFVFLLYGFIEGGVNRKSKFPPASEILPATSRINKITHFLMSAVFIELLLGNSVNVVAGLHSSSVSSSVLIAAFDFSLIMFGVFLLFRRGKDDEHLNRLACLERDIVIHEIPKEEILERLQDEHLGRYLGDWIEQLLKESREKGNEITSHSDKVDEFLAEVSAIDKSYERERKGRVEEYVDELERKNDSYHQSIHPLLEWLKQASVQSALHNDSFMRSIIKSSADELKESSNEVSEKQKMAVKKLREWLGSE